MANTRASGRGWDDPAQSLCANDAKGPDVKYQRSEDPLNPSICCFFGGSCFVLPYALRPEMSPPSHGREAAARCATGCRRGLLMHVLVAAHDMSAACIHGRRWQTTVRTSHDRQSLPCLFAIWGLSFPATQALCNGPETGATAWCLGIRRDALTRAPLGSHRSPEARRFPDFALRSGGQSREIGGGIAETRCPPQT